MESLRTSPGAPLADSRRWSACVIWFSVPGRAARPVAPWTEDVLSLRVCGIASESDRPSHQEFGPPGDPDRHAGQQQGDDQP